MVFQIGFPAGLIALAVLVPLIIIYLRRPKALMRTIPSLMFFSEHKGRFRSSSWFRKLVRNILFLIQLLVLLMLAFSCAQPAVTNERLMFLQHTVLVLDTSASMTGSFEALQSEARRAVAAETSILVATSPSRVMVERATPDRALGALQDATPTDRRADLSGAVLRAVGMAQETPSRIVVITDRRSALSEGVIELAENRGHRVAIVDVSAPVRDNVGFTDARITAYDADVAIRNFGGATQVTVRGPESSYALDIPSRGVRRLTLPLVEGENTFTLEPAGAFGFDSTLYVSNTARSSISALVVTISDTTLPVERALSAIDRTDISITRNRLGTITREYDLLVLSNYATDLVLPSFYSDARGMVERGAILIIGKNARTGPIPDDLMPVTIDGVREGEHVVSGQGSVLTEAVEFSPITDPLEARLRNGSISLARAGDTQVVAIRPLGAGAVVYYGYDDASDFFVNTPSYPILWSNIVDEITGARTVGRFNVETGTTRTLPTPSRVAFPDGSERVVPSIPFDRVGFYRVGDAVFAANVLDSSESDPSYVIEERIIEAQDSARSNVEIPLVGLLAALALLFVVFEVYLLKRRGEL
ncbi:MAG: vWA domain-containing protein [Candidatus Woesearchaeota archaeon]